MKFTLIKEMLRLSLDSLRAQMLRTVLTALIISIGITALVGILTAGDGIKATISSELATMGSRSFSIQNWGMNIQIGRRGIRPKTHPSITWRQANEFARKFDFEGSKTSLFFTVTGMAELKHSSKKTNPNVRIVAGDENYLLSQGYEIATGRNLNTKDVENNAQVAIIGQDVVDLLFDGAEDALGKHINFRGHRFQVIGVLSSKGSGFGFSGDRIVMIPVSFAKATFAAPTATFSLVVIAASDALLEATIDEATALMRNIRKLNPLEETNFHITKSDNLARLVNENIGKITGGLSLIGIITLLGASISLMNIMLVSVTERTREIGTLKALGAPSWAIRWQFLIEAVLICQLGGLLGIVLGIASGNVLALLIDGVFVIPWTPIIIALIVCFIVGITAGFYPASKAAKLDPIEALRYE